MATPLYASRQVRQLEAALEHQHGLAPAQLMERAGSALFAHIRCHWPEARRVLVVAGTGNNGGDGYVLARLLRAAGIGVEVRALADSRSDPAAAAAAAWQEAGGGTRLQQGATALPETDLVVDALFGIGLSRPPDHHSGALIEAINSSGAPVLSVDLPSGVDADTGDVPGVAVAASRTLCLLVGKRGLHTGAALDQVGALAVDALDVDAAIVPEPADSGAVTLMRAGDLGSALPARRRGAHKGQHGHVLVVGGDHGMTGAVRLAGVAALRAGAGWVSIASRAGLAAAIGLDRPELMVHGVEDAPALAPLLMRASALAVGPGLGLGEWSQTLLDAALDKGLPLVLDADALNLLTRQPQRVGPHAVITPHPGEAARLLGQTVAEVERDRYAAVRALATQHQCVVVLKGAGSLVDDGRSCRVCPFGNPGMASAGMGDALTGVIAALLAQGLAPAPAAAAGVLAHALAGDLAARKGQRGLLAGDLIDCLRTVLNP